MRVALPCVAQFVIVLDVTIVAIALPAMQADLGMSTSTLAWVITAYTLGFGGCLVAAGRLADRVGRRRAFVGGLTLFAAASLACGLAPLGAVLLAARAVQGLGAALVSLAALALVTSARPTGPPRARALGWWTAAAAGGGASGWVVGGLLSGLLGWRWVFLVNVPLCLLAAALAPRVLAEWREPARGRLDIGGAFLVTTGVGALLFALTLVETHGLLASITLLVAGLAAALLLCLLRVERHARDPLLRADLFRRNGFTSANAVAAVLTAVTSPPILLCTLHAQQVLGLPPAAAGLLFAPVNLAVIAGSLAGPRVVARLGERVAMAAGLMTVAMGAVALRAIGVGVPALPSLLGGFVVLGLGLGVASVASTSLGTAVVRGDDRGLASGLLASSAQLGTAFGLAVIVPLATAHTHTLGDSPAARVAGYELGFTLAAGLALAGAVALAVGGGWSRRRRAEKPYRRLWQRATT